MWLVHYVDVKGFDQDVRRTVAGSLDGRSVGLACLSECAEIAEIVGGHVRL